MNNGKICVSVCAKTADEFHDGFKRAEELADAIELRFDCLAENQVNRAKLKLIELCENCQTTLIATFRPTKKLGGSRDVSLKPRIAFWMDILYAKAFETIDLEYGFPFELAGETFLNRLANHELILSFHDFEKTPSNLDSIYEGMLKTTVADGYKIAVQAHDAADGLAVMKLLDRAFFDDVDLIAIAMGEAGVWTRILNLSRGSIATFAALDEASATAPGQLTAREMIDIYRVKELDENTEIYGLVGSSVSQSVSPQSHNTAFKFHRMNAVYVPFAVKNLEEFMRRMVISQTREIDWNLRGFSVTIPHKIEIMKYLDFVDETARKIGAVNTVKIEGDKLSGFNTDADGFIEPLKNVYGDLNRKRVAVFGAGGAARACVYALLRENANVTVFARNAEKAKNLAADFGVEIQDFKSQNSNLRNFDVVVNATPLGMKKGGLENETPATADELKGVGLVYDLVYNPSETRLMREAAQAFVPTIGGLAMLVAQAAAQQKIWTGKDAPVKEMSAAALRKLQS